jgi:hypothetical protein
VGRQLGREAERGGAGTVIVRSVLVAALFFGHEVSETENELQLLAVGWRVYQYATVSI